MNLSVVIPAHNEEEGVRPTVERLYGALMDAAIPFEILVVNDHSTDQTEQVLQQLARELPGVRYVNNTKPGGFGFAIQTGLERFHGDAVCIAMADASDDPGDVVAYYRKLEEGYECVFGSRFARGSRVVDYPTHKLFINRLANRFIDVLFRLHFNDTTNAFKAYRREVIEGVRPILSSHFNITVELPLKAITRGYTYTTVPINWYNRATGVSKLKIQEMGSRYLFIVLYVWLEQLLSRGDYRRRNAPLAVSASASASGIPLEERAGEIAATVPRMRQVSTQTVDADVVIQPAMQDPTRAVAASSGAHASTRPNAAPGATSFAQRSSAIIPVVAGIVGLVPALLIGFILMMIWARTPHVPYWDEWITVGLVQRFNQGTISWSDFWGFHNEHRIVIPQMIDLVLVLATHFNRQIEMTFDLLMSVAEWGLLLICAYRGLRSKALTVLALAPMALAVFSLTQYEDWLWPFQITFICTVFGVALCLWGLTSPQKSWRAFAVTLIGAVIAALSSLGGLAVFIAFLPAVISQGYKRTIIWIALAVGIIVPYMRGFPHSVPITISLSTLKFCLTYLGAPVGSPSAKVAFLAGAASLALAAANVLFYWIREKRITPLLPWIGLGGYAIGLSLVTSFGRVTLGLWSTIALTSRYQAFAVLWWVAVVYLLLLNFRGAFAQIGRAGSDTSLITRVSPWFISANTLLLITATAGLALSSWQSVSHMETFQYTQLRTERCVVNVDYATTPCLWMFYPVPQDLQQPTAYLRAQHYAIFGENYQGLVQPVPNPSTHPLVRYFDASAGDHWITTSYEVNYYGTYTAEAVLGQLYDQQQPGTHALFTCETSDGHHFSSLNATCAGGTNQRTEGWLLNAPVAGINTVPLYSCVDKSDAFISQLPTCEGQTGHALLGYAIAPQRP